ncbi:MAG: FG-GAP-like repeat-containing protein, partial [Myxococcota bacterium]
TGAVLDTGATPSPDAVWLVGGPQAFAGEAVSVLDVDGDGVAELAVAGYDAVWVASAPWADSPIADAADWTAPGTFIATLLPDLTGDAVPDLAVGGQCQLEVHRGPFVAGAVPDPYASFQFDVGGSAAVCPDLDGDGDGELCLGSDPTCSFVTDLPAVAVYTLPLPPAGLWRTDAALTIEADGSEVEPGAVDLDGDGVDEITIAAPDADGRDGRVWLVRDPPLGAFDLADAAAMWSADGAGGAGEETARGDLDGDGRDDLAIAAPRFHDGSGYYVPATGRVWVATDDAGGPLGGVATTVGAPDPVAQFGAGLAVADLDGDGVPDLAASAIVQDPPGPGRVAVFFGPLASGAVAWTDADRVVVGWGPEDFHGLDLAVGDLDGDGLSDLVASGTGDWNGTPRAGAVHLVFDLGAR